VPNGPYTGDTICASLNGQSGINNWSCVSAVVHDQYNYYSDANCLMAKHPIDITDLVSCSRQLSASQSLCEPIENSTWRKIKSFDAAICCNLK
jgi:hypothetical protein